MNKVVIVGTGSVGSSYAYSLINQNLVDELVLINRTKAHAVATAEDIIHGTIFLNRQPKIYAGSYEDCQDADLICITSGVSQQVGETRIDLLNKNAKIIKDIVEEIMKFKFDGVLLIASNPVDIMTGVAHQVSGLPADKVIGSGTVLDTSRLKHNVAQYLGYSVTEIYANIIGEHGDDSLPIWSTSRVGNKPIINIIEENPEKYNMQGLDECFEKARDVAYEIIEAKGSTCYGIGLTLTKITKAVLYDENVILPVSQYVDGFYGLTGVYISVPAVISKKGRREVFENRITSNEQELLYKAEKKLKKHFNEIKGV